MENIIIKTKRTEMKFPIDYIDENKIVEAIGHADTIKFMDSVENTFYTIDDASRFMKFLEYTRTLDEFLELGIFDINNNKFIGMCTLENIDRKEKSCELGYWLNVNYVGKGYMKECTSALIEYAKTSLEMEKINAYVIVEHEKSIALLERLGFINKEVLLNNSENKGELVDRYRFELKFR